MAISENGPFGNHRGKLGNIVYYTLNGVPLSRTVGIIRTGASEKQRKCWDRVGISGRFLQVFKDFFFATFVVEIAGTTSNQFSMATKYNLKEIIRGEHPDYYVNFDKLVLSKGTLDNPHDIQVEVNPEGLLFRWDTDPKMSWPGSADQAMVLAYFPLTHQALFNLYGNNRAKGSELLEIPPPMLKEWMEVYICFASADRKRFSDSVYLGSLNS